MCLRCGDIKKTHVVRKFAVDDGREDEPNAEAVAKAEEDARDREKEMAAAVIVAILWLRGAVKCAPPYAVLPDDIWRGFNDQLRKALIPGFAIHDLAANAVMTGIGTFDPLDPATINRQAAYRDTFIQEFGGETRKAFEAANAWGIKKELESPIIKGLLVALAGLNTRQTGAALTQWASRQASGATEKSLAKMLEATAKKLMKQRAKTTAESEGWRLLNLGQWSAMDQEERKGAIVIKDWFVTEDERLCERCAAIPGMNPNGVPIGRPFNTPNGPLMFSPLHTSCRCKTLYWIKRGSF